MKLATIQQLDNIVIEQLQDNNNSIITNKVKITNKRRQSAINTKERLELQYSNGIDKQNKKRAFFAKHKNK